MFNRWHRPSASSGLCELRLCRRTSCLSWCGRIPPSRSAGSPYFHHPQPENIGFVWWEYSTYANGRRRIRRRSECRRKGPPSLDAYNIWFRSAGTSPRTIGNVLCGQNFKRTLPDLGTERPRAVLCKRKKTSDGGDRLESEGQTVERISRVRFVQL